MAVEIGRIPTGRQSGIVPLRLASARPIPKWAGLGVHSGILSSLVLNVVMLSTTGTACPLTAALVLRKIFWRLDGVFVGRW